MCVCVCVCVCFVHLFEWIINCTRCTVNTSKELSYVFVETCGVLSGTVHEVQTGFCRATGPVVSNTKQ